MKYPTPTSLLTVLGLLTVCASPAQAAVITLSIAGSDAIFLAGRTDLTIPDASDPWTGPGDFLRRHGGPTPEEIKETGASVHPGQRCGCAESG